LAQTFRRWVVDHVVIPFFIGDTDGRSALDALLKATWRAELGLRLPLDLLAIDEGSFPEDVRSWAKRHPLTRVIRVKGASSAGRSCAEADAGAPRQWWGLARNKGGWLVNVSQLKADFFQWLTRTILSERG